LVAIQKFMPKMILLLGIARDIKGAVDEIRAKKLEQGIKRLGAALGKANNLVGGNKFLKGLANLLDKALPKMMAILGLAVPLAHNAGHTKIIIGLGHSGTFRVVFHQKALLALAQVAPAGPGAVDHQSA
jgi:hypothetical protein